MTKDSKKTHNSALKTAKTNFRKLLPSVTRAKKEQERKQHQNIKKPKPQLLQWLTHSWIMREEIRWQNLEKNEIFCSIFALFLLYFCSRAAPMCHDAHQRTGNNTTSKHQKAKKFHCSIELRFPQKNRKQYDVKMPKKKKLCCSIELQLFQKNRKHYDIKN